MSDREEEGAVPCLAGTRFLRETIWVHLTSKSCPVRLRQAWFATRDYLVPVQEPFIRQLAIHRSKVVRWLAFDRVKASELEYHAT